MAMAHMMKVGTLSLGLALLAGISAPGQAQAAMWVNGGGNNGSFNNGGGNNGGNTNGGGTNGHSSAAITENVQDAGGADLGALAIRSIRLQDGSLLTVAGH
jgi:hypothetical protein